MKKIDDLFFPPRTIKKGAVNVGSLSVKNYQVLKVMPYGISCKLTRKLVPRHTKWSQHISEIAFELFIILPSMVFCYQNCSELLWETNVLVIKKNFWNSRPRPRICKIFEITRTIYSNSERSEQFLVTDLVPGGFSYLID